MMHPNAATVRGPASVLMQLNILYANIPLLFKTAPLPTNAQETGLK